MRTKMVGAVVAGLVAAMLIGGAGIASAGDRLQLRDQLKDGSCQVAGDRIMLQTRTRDC